MTKLKLKTVMLLSGATMLLASCGSDPNAASEANFEKALNAHYASMKECLQVGSKPNDAGIIQEFQTDRSIQDNSFLFTMALWIWVYWKL